MLNINSIKSNSEIQLDPHKLYSVQLSGTLSLERQYRQGVGDKPNGLWYAFGSEWMDFHPQALESEKLSIFEVEIDRARLLHIANKKMIRTIDSTYWAPLGIDWRQVAQAYDGIEVSPFIDSCDMPGWYKTFDISSGCIWNIAATKKIERVYVKTS